MRTAEGRARPPPCAGAGADARAGRAGRTTCSSRWPRHAGCSLARVLRRHADGAADQGLREGHRHRRRHARPAHRPRRPRRAVGRATSRSSCSTRPTAWPTWASCRRSSGSCAASQRDHQTMLFSATLDRDVDHLIRLYLRDPVRHEVESGHRHRRRDAAPLPRRAPDGQGQGGRRHRPRPTTAR